MTQNKLICSKVAFIKYLTPDYFLSSSSNSSYYSKKYSGNHASTSIGSNAICQSKRGKIYRVASIMLLSLGFLAIAVEVKASDSIELQKEVSSGKQKDSTFAVTYLSNNLPDVVPTLPLPDLIPSNPPVTPPPPPPMPPLPDIVPQLPLPDVVQVSSAPPAPPMALSQPDLVSDAAPKTKQKSGFMASMQEIVKGNFKLKKVKQEPKPVVVSSGDQDLMSQLHNTLERRRKGIAGEKKNNKFKKAAKQVIVLNAEEEQARATEIAKQIAENKERALTLRKQKEKEWAIKAKKIEAEVEIEKQRKAAEHARAMREKKAKDNGDNSSTVITGIDPILHKNMVADLRQEISSLKEQLTLNSHVTSEGINSVESVNPIRSKRSLEDSKIVETKDQSTSTEDASLLEDRLFDKKLENWQFEEDEAIKKLDEVISTYSDSDSGYDESLEDSSDRGRKNSLDTNYVVSKIVSQSNSIVSETVQDELADVEQESKNYSHRN